VKKQLFISVSVLVLGCAWIAGAAIAEPAEESADTAKLGYFFGYYFGNLLKEQGSVDIDLDEMRRGIADSVAGKISALNPEEQQALMAVIRSRQTGQEAASRTAGSTSLSGRKRQERGGEGHSVRPSVSSLGKRHRQRPNFDR
jgi:hypothetical protein